MMLVCVYYIFSGGIMRKVILIFLLFLGVIHFALGQAVRDEEIVLEISKDSPIKGKTILVFPAPSEYKSMEKDEDLRFLVDTINSYLSELGIGYVEFQRSLDISKKFKAVYEEKRGEAMSLAQILANEIKAPIYVEVDIDVKVSPYPNMKGWVLVEGISTIKAYDSSTARGLGVSQVGKKLVNNSTDELKARRVVLSYIAKYALKELLPKCEKYLMKGEKIEIKFIGIRNIKESKDFLEFLNSLPGTKEAKRKSISGDLAVYEIDYGGGVDEFLNDFSDLILTYPEYEKLKIDQVGNSIIIKR